MWSIRKNGEIPFLHYEGNVKIPIVIPEGIKSCFGMFAFRYFLKIAPKIPGTVTDCSHMFENCESIETAPELPPGVENC